MILTTLKVELPLLVPRRCPSERFIVNIHVLEIAADLDWVGDGADLLHRATAGVACGDVDLEDLGKQLGPAIVAQRLGIAVVIVFPELEPLFDLWVKGQLPSLRRVRREHTRPAHKVSPGWRNNY